MSKHVASRHTRNTTPRRTRFFRLLRSARVRALLSLGIVLGFGATSTLAYWTDTATVTGGTFTAGTLDLQVNDAQGNPTAYALTSLAMADM